MTDPRIEQSLAEMIAELKQPAEWETPTHWDCAERLTAWHARAMKLANEMEHYGHVTHYPAMCAKCRLLALLGDLP